MAQMAFLTLNNGIKFPCFGLGTWQAPPGAVAEAVTAAIDAGYRHFDCAEIYGNEAEIGGAFKAAFESGKINREDIWVTSKNWNTHRDPVDVKKAAEQTIKNLQIGYLDLYLIHWPIPSFPQGGFDNYLAVKVPKDESNRHIFNKVPMYKTWAAMEALVDAGLTKSIGVSNFGTAMLVDMMTYARIPPAMNQIEVNPLHTREDLITFCHQFNIQVTAYSQFGSTGASYLKLEPVVAIAEKHKKTPAQVILRWLLDQNIVAIPKSVGAARIKENINVFDFKLSEDEIKQISACNKNEGTNVAKEFFGLNIFV